MSVVYRLDCKVGFKIVSKKLLLIIFIFLNAFCFGYANDPLEGTIEQLKQQSLRVSKLRDLAQFFKEERHLTPLLSSLLSYSGCSFDQAITDVICSKLKLNPEKGIPFEMQRGFYLENYSEVLQRVENIVKHIISSFIDGNVTDAQFISFIHHAQNELKSWYKEIKRTAFETFYKRVEPIFRDKNVSPYSELDVFFFFTIVLYGPLRIFPNAHAELAVLKHIRITESLQEEKDYIIALLQQDTQKTREIVKSTVNVLARSLETYKYVPYKYVPCVSPCVFLDVLIEDRLCSAESNMPFFDRIIATLNRIEQIFTQRTSEFLSRCWFMTDLMLFGRLNLDPLRLLLIAFIEIDSEKELGEFDEFEHKKIIDWAIEQPEQMVALLNNILALVSKSDRVTIYQLLFQRMYVKKRSDVKNMLLAVLKKEPVPPELLEAFTKADRPLLIDILCKNRGCPFEARSIY